MKRHSISSAGIFLMVVIVFVVAWFSAWVSKPEPKQPQEKIKYPKMIFNFKGLEILNRAVDVESIYLYYGIRGLSPYRLYPPRHYTKPLETAWHCYVDVKTPFGDHQLHGEGDTIHEAIVWAIAEYHRKVNQLCREKPQ